MQAEPLSSAFLLPFLNHRLYFTFHDDHLVCMFDFCTTEKKKAPVYTMKNE